MDWGKHHGIEENHRRQIGDHFWVLPCHSHFVYQLAFHIMGDHSRVVQLALRDLLCDPVLAETNAEN
jgi:hypothetical protein